MLPTFSRPTATKTLEAFQIQFEQTCGDNEMFKMGFSKIEEEPSRIIQRPSTRKRGNYDDEMVALGHVYIKCPSCKMAKRDLAKGDQLSGESL